MHASDEWTLHLQVLYRGIHFVVAFGRRASAGEEIDHHCAMTCPASAPAVALPLGPPSASRSLISGQIEAYTR